MRILAETYLGKETVSLDPSTMKFCSTIPSPGLWIIILGADSDAGTLSSCSQSKVSYL